MSPTPEFSSPREAAYDPRILVFGRLLGAANRLDYILGRALEEQTGLSHTVFELLLVVGRTYLRDFERILEALRATMAPDVEWTEMAGFPWPAPTAHPRASRRTS